MKSFSVLTLIVFTTCGNPSLINTGDAENFTLVEDAMPSMKSANMPMEENVSLTKKIIKNGGINFQSKNVADDYKSIQKMLPKFEAYIENENQSKEYDQLVYSLTLRVPAEKFDSLFTSIVGIATRLESKYSNIEDVTERFYDLQTRIKNKKALEARYLDLLNKTTSIKDILEIERSLNEIRTEIESMEGQFKFLNSQISLSTVQLRFYELLPIADDGYPRKGFGARMLNALNGGWQGFLSFLVGLVTLWPFVLIAIGGIYAFRKIRKRLRN